MSIMEIGDISAMKVMLGAILVVLAHLLHVFVLKPRSLRAKLQKQGIGGPSPHFYFGNIPEMKSLLHQAHSLKDDVSTSISHNWLSFVFPHILKWRKQYGPIYLFSSGSIQWLMVTDIEMVKEIVLNTSLILGKPSFLSKDNRPLLGKGILSSSGLFWAHQRKIIAPELYLDKMKTKVGMIVDSTNIMLRSWETKLEKDGVSDIKVDQDLRNLSGDIIARACFGSNYVEGREIFSKLRELQNIICKIFAGIPGFRYLPNKSNRQMWRLEKEISSKISKLIKQRQIDAHDEHDLLQMILDSAKKCESDGDSFLPNATSRERFMIDNCKNIFFAGYETTAITTSWCLMLLATHPDWQDRVRAEVLKICGNDGIVDANQLKSMKTLTMVIQETLRLYPPALSVVRQAFEDINFKGIQIPKGMNLQIPMPILHQDPELWGHDAHKFNPERFANGVHGACKIPQVYMPFGMGPRVCLGQHLAMVELKVILSLILLKFQFSLSSSYCHSPSYHMLVEPGHGVALHMTKI